MENFKQKYIEEANEIIAVLEESILNLESNRNNPEVIEEVFRSMHTLKGGAAMFGFEKIRDVTHELENIYDLIRNGKKEISKLLLDTTLEGIDYFKTILNETHNDPGNNYHNQLVDKIVKIPEAKEEPKTAAQQANPEPENINIENETQEEQEKEVRDVQKKEPGTEQGTIETYYIYFKPSKEVLKNGTNPLLLIKELSELGQTNVFSFSSDVPAFSNLNIEELFFGWHILVATDKGQAELEDVFIFVQDESSLEIARLTDSNLLESYKNQFKIDNLLSSAKDNCLNKIKQLLGDDPDETMQEANKSEPQTEDIKSLIKEATQSNKPEAEEAKKEAFLEENTSQANNGKKKNAISSLRISAEKVDDLMNLVSELVTTQARLNLYKEHNSTPELEAIAENIQKLSSRLRDNAFDLSLIPLQSVVTRFQRMVRDLSAELDKEIIFNTKGTDTELDKSIIENLADPIMHILRNCIDHGIEDKKTREKAGKPKQGEIMLKAYYSGANVHIEISDDGKGIDHNEVKKQAISKGLITKDTQMTRKELLEMIFIPGFSTSQNVTEVSGRGVGMDVVKDKISEIRGEVEIDSTLGRGTVITIKLPLTLSIIDGLLTRIGNTNYIIPLNVVDKIYRIKHEELNESFYNTLVLSGEQIPYYYLREEFLDKENAPAKEQVIVVSYDEKQYGLVVDKVVGEYQAVLKPLGKHYRRLQFFSGATILGDGSVALVMDTNKIINHFSKLTKTEVKYG
jgi:two-component system chemotaxis sensor kinase CheA